MVGAGLLVVNTVASGLAVLTGLSLRLLGVFGDLVLIEAGLLAIIGGLVEFSRSKGVYEFRRLAMHSTDEFSTTKHTEASRNAVVFFTAALVLFSILMVLILIG